MFFPFEKGDNNQYSQFGHDMHHFLAFRHRQKLDFAIFDNNWAAYNSQWEIEIMSSVGDCLEFRIILISS